jgi:hypothetical protein
MNSPNAAVIAMMPKSATARSANRQSALISDRLFCRIRYERQRTEFTVALT